MDITADYVSLKFGKCKNVSSIFRCQYHNERQRSRIEYNSILRPELSKFNYYLKSCDTSYNIFVQNRLREENIKPIYGAILMGEGIVSASAGFLENMHFEEQRQYFTYAYGFLQERLDEKNIISAVVHMDENEPHMHFTFVPITKDGRLNFSHTLSHPDGPDGPNRNIFADFDIYMKKRYPQISPHQFKTGMHFKSRYSEIFREYEPQLRCYQAITVSASEMNASNISRNRTVILQSADKAAMDAKRMLENMEQLDRAIWEKTIKAGAFRAEIGLEERRRDAQIELNAGLLKELGSVRTETEALRENMKKIPPEERGQYFAVAVTGKEPPPEIRRRYLREEAK